MKAAILHGKENIKIENVSLPVLENDSLIIKVEKASICNTTDNKVYRADDPSKFWPYQRPPFVLGHECYGKIVEIGKNLKNIYKKDEYVIFWCMGYGAFAEYACIFPKYLAITKVDCNLNSDFGPIFEPVTATLRLLIDGGKFLIKKNDTVLILGDGPSALLYLQYSKILQSKKVILIGHYDFRIKKAKQLGADLTLNSKKQDVNYLIKELKDNVDVVIDTTGKNIFDQAVLAIKKNGNFIHFGVPDDEGILKKREILKNKNVKIVNTTNNENTQKAIEKGKSWVSENILNLETLITHKIKLEDIKKGLDLCYYEKDKTLKVILEMT